MSWLRMFGVVGSLAVLFTASACQQETPVEPDPIVYPLITENYTGAVEVGGSKAFSFTVTNPGAINVSMTSLSPISTLTMGMGLGGWDIVNLTCTEGLAFTGVRVNTVHTGTPQSAGAYCVTVYDVGNLQATSEFALTLTHY